MEEHKDFYDISWKVPEEEYRADPALSYSSIAKFAREGFKAVSHLGDKIESQALTFGSAVDSIITGGQEEFNSRFFVADFPDIPDSIIQIVKVLFSRYSEEILSLNDLDSKILMDIALGFNYQNNWKPETKAKVICEKGDTYFGLLLMAKDKTILDLNTFKLVQNAVNALKDSPTTNKYFQLDNPWENKKRYYQLKFKFNHNGVDYRSMADLIIVDYDKKIVYPIDLKTSGHNEWDFQDSFIQWRYDIQARLYWRNIRANMDADEYFKDFTLDDYTFIVVNKLNCIPLVWNFSRTQVLGDIQVNDIILQDPYVLGEDLNLYLKNPSTVPHGIYLDKPNDIINWLNKKVCK